MSSTQPVLTLTIEQHGKTSVVHCVGKLVFGHTDLLYNPVMQLMADHHHIVLDLAGLTHMDSMGLGSFVRIYVASKAKGCNLELRNLGQKVRELLIMTNLLPVFSSVGETRMWM